MDQSSRNLRTRRQRTRRQRYGTVHAVRKQILQILKERGGATVAELADALGMAAVSVRHHLDILQGDNLIAVDRLERKGNVGRPQQVYALTPEANEHFPDNFAGLAAGLLIQMKQFLPEDQVNLAFESIAKEIAQELPVQDIDSADVEARLTQVTAFLSERGYLARWERQESDEGPFFLLHKHNCPYAGISGEHPELCRMDQRLIDELVGSHCERTQSMRDDEHCCTYRVQHDAPVEILLV